MRYYEIEEAKRIGSGIYKSEIHPKLKNLTILNRGTTSMVLEKDPETVIVLTKDPIKRDWLVHELGIADQKFMYDTKHPKLHDMPIYVLEMPRLYPLGPKTRKAARELLKHFDEIYYKAINAMHRHTSMTKMDILNWFYKFFDEYNKNNTDEHALSQLVNFLRDYDPDQYEWDLRMGNLMQDKDENLVILDPIIDKEIIDIFHYNR